MPEQYDGGWAEPIRPPRPPRLDLGPCDCSECRAKRMERVQNPEGNARALLMEYLDPHQRVALRQSGYFDVVAQFGATYRLSIDGAVFAMDGPNTGRAFCITMYGYPYSDAVLARKLLLETNELAFLRIACASGGRGPVVYPSYEAVA